MASADLGKTLSEEVAKFNQLQQDMQKVVQSRHQLESQLNENTIVKEELDILDGDARVFKLIGPALMKQDLKEAKDNVNNRIKYITDEIKRQEDTIKDIETKQETHRENIRKIQQQMQQQQTSSTAPTASLPGIPEAGK